MARARDFMLANELGSMPDGEVCEVLPAPPFQRPAIAVASYTLSPPLSDSRVGHFFVPYPPDGVSEEESQKRLASNAYASMPTTAAHETYPGHHWHLSMARRNKSRIRHAFRSAFFSEGWALYAERLMQEHGFFHEPAQRIKHLEAAMFRAARVVVDTSLHAGEMSWDDAVTFMTANTALTAPTAMAEVTRYCAWPTQASAYHTGCDEILRIRESFLARHGASESLRSFHDRIASSVGLPLRLAEKALMQDADPAARDQGGVQPRIRLP
jgi:uncharacterized protein (DUF885 family)